MQWSTVQPDQGIPPRDADPRDASVERSWGGRCRCCRSSSGGRRPNRTFGNNLFESCWPWADPSSSCFVAIAVHDSSCCLGPLAEVLSLANHVSGPGAERFSPSLNVSLRSTRGDTVLEPPPPRSATTSWSGHWSRVELTSGAQAIGVVQNRCTRGDDLATRSRRYLEPGEHSVKVIRCLSSNQGAGSPRTRRREVWRRCTSKLSGIGARPCSGGVAARRRFPRPRFSPMEAASTAADLVPC